MLKNSGISSEYRLSKIYDSKNGELGENLSKVIVAKQNHP